MGADFLLATLVIDKAREPDFAAGQAAIERLGPDQIELVDEFDAVPDTEEGMASIRQALAEALDKLQCGLAGREVEWIEVRGATVYLTGGPSWGESPTELFAVIDRLRCVRGVLSAVGFESEG